MKGIAGAEKQNIPDIFSRGKKIIAVELDPPKDDDAAFFLDGARELKNAGADIITIADSPMGQARMDSCMLAAKIKREYQIEPLPHMTCRDRNQNAIQAALLGLAMEEICNILLVTGDPIPPEEKENIRPVFQFHSRRLAEMVRDMNDHHFFRRPFRMFGALNINARHFDIELKRAEEKESRGMSGFFTQPVLSPEALKNLKQAREILSGGLFGGIFPIVSYRNAVFLNQHVHGIRVSDEIIALYENKDREEAEKIAVEVSVKTAREIEPYTDGLYLMTPFRRVALMTEIIRAVRE